MATLATSNDAQRYITAVLLLGFCAVVLLQATPTVSFRAGTFGRAAQSAGVLFPAFAQQRALDQGEAPVSAPGEVAGDRLVRRHAILVVDRSAARGGQPDLDRAQTARGQDDPPGAPVAAPPQKPLLPELPFRPPYENDALIADQVLSWSKKRDLHPLLVWVVIDAESNGDPYAVSGEGALGLMQVMPFHFKYGDDPFDLATNVERGTGVLASYLAELGSLRLALAAYNAGPVAVHRHGGVPPYPETRRYLNKTLDRYLGLIEAANTRGVDPFSLRYVSDL